MCVIIFCVTGVNLASLVLRDPNIISYYIENTPLESINEELLMWLLESGVPVDRYKLNTIFSYFN